MQLQEYSMKVGVRSIALKAKAHRNPKHRGVVPEIRVVR